MAVIQKSISRPSSQLSSKLRSVVLYALFCGILLSSTVTTAQIQAPYVPLPVPTQQKLAMAQRYYQVGFQLENTGKLEEALNAYREYDKNLPEQDVSGAIQIARVLMRLRRWDELETMWLGKRKYAPESFRPQIDSELGAIAWQRGDVAGARAKWRAMLDANRSEASYHTIYSVLVQYNLPEEAVRILTEGRTELRNPSLFSSQLFQLYLLTMNPRGAAIEAAMQITANPNTEQNWTYQLTQFSGDEETSQVILDELNKAAVKAGNAAQAALAGLRSAVAFRSQRFDLAVREAAFADSISRGNGNRCLLLTSNLLAEGDAVSARKALEFAVRRQATELPQTLGLLSRIDLQQGDTTSAMRHWERIVERFPGDPECELSLLRLARLETKRNPGKAIEYLEKAHRMPIAQHRSEANVLHIDALLNSGRTESAMKLIEQSAADRGSTDYMQWEGTILLRWWQILLLGTMPDSLVTANLSRLDGVRFDDIAAVEAMRWRILWNSVATDNNWSALLRTGERAMVRNDTTTLTRTIELILQHSDKTPFELLVRVCDWTDNFEMFQRCVTQMRTRDRSDARLASLMLRLATMSHRRGDEAAAIKLLEEILRDFPNRPEEDVARKQLRKWSRSG